MTHVIIVLSQSYYMIHIMTKSSAEIVEAYYPNLELLT